MRYGWNYARLLTEGPSEQALVPSPVLRAMRDGALVRVEELTRIPSDVQDALITILSEKTLPIPELGTEVQAAPGFNVIATANDRDRGVNELSSALRRRFNTVLLPLPASADDEVAIVGRRVADIGRALELPDLPSADAEIRRVVTVFRELRGRRHRRRPGQPQDPDGHAVAGGGDLGRDQWLVPGRPLRRRGAPPVRPGRQHRRCRGQGSRPRHGRLAGVRRGGDAGPAGLGGLLPRLPRRCDAAVGACGGPGPRRPPPRAGLGPLHARRARRASDRTSCASRARRRPRPSRPSPPIRPWRRRWRCSPTTSTIPRRRRSGRSPASAPSGRRCAGRSGTGARCGSSTCPRRMCWPPAPIERSRTLERPDPLAGLAAAAGYDDVERWWDDLVEHRDRRGVRRRRRGDGRRCARPRRRCRPAAMDAGGRRTCGWRPRGDGRRGFGPGRRRVRRVARPGARSDHSLAPAAAGQRRCSGGCRRSRWR